jgi:hypothetical protein
VLDFVLRDDLETFTAFVAGLKAFGGGDIPEDVHGGVEACTAIALLSVHDFHTLSLLLRVSHAL